MDFAELLSTTASKLKPDSAMLLFSQTTKRRNRDVFYDYRNSSDIIYLTGLNIPDIILYISSDKKIIFYLNFPDPGQERWTGKMITPEILQSRFKLEKDNIRESKNFWNDLPEILKNKRSLYIDFNMQNDDFVKIIKAVNDLNKNNRDATCGPDQLLHVGEILHEARVIKSRDEIEKIQRAAQVTQKGFIGVMKFTRKPGDEILYEYQIKSAVESIFRNSGIMDIAYPTIVASGNNANYLHYADHSRQIQRHDLILMDAGCEYMGYASDVTRTFPANGKFSESQKEIYKIVLEAQKNAIGLCQIGNTFEDIHNKAVHTVVSGLWNLGLFKEIPDANDNKERIQPLSIEEVIEKKYFRIFYMHYTSHFLGLDVHDVGKYYIDGKSRLLQSGMVFTVEPGIYLSEDYDFIPEKYRGIGIRIEDDILITENGHEILTKGIPKEIKEIEEITA
ncbi:MAG: aminopeptidase P family protein [Spirochaetia bacterium]|nr:aminopeptidase P family protein [Spirochaetia bacterium]